MQGIYNKEIINATRHQVIILFYIPFLNHPVNEIEKCYVTKFEIYN